MVGKAPIQFQTDQRDQEEKHVTATTRRKCARERREAPPIHRSRSPPRMASLQGRPPRPQANSKRASGRDHVHVSAHRRCADSTVQVRPRRPRHTLRLQNAREQGSCLTADASALDSDEHLRPRAAVRRSSACADLNRRRNGGTAQTVVKLRHRETLRGVVKRLSKNPCTMQAG